MLVEIMIICGVLTFIILLLCIGLHFVAPQLARNIYFLFRNMFGAPMSLVAGIMSYYLLANCCPAVQDWKCLSKIILSICIMMAVYGISERYLLGYTDRLMDRGYLRNANE